MTVLVIFRSVADEHRTRSERPTKALADRGDVQWVVLEAGSARPGFVRQLLTVLGAVRFRKTVLVR